MHFYLNEYCYLVSGAKKCAIYNFKDNKLYSLDYGNSKLLRLSEKGQPIDEYYKENSIFKQLENSELGFTTNSPCYIDKVRILNTSIIKRMDLNPPKVEKLYVRLNNECMGKCKECSKIFCPICSIQSNGKIENLDCTTWINIIDKISYIGLKSIIFTGGDPFLYKDLDKLIEFCKTKDIEVTLVTNGIQKVEENIPKDINIILTAFEDRDYKSILNKFKAFKKVSVKYSNERIYNNIKKLNYENLSINKANFVEKEIGKDSLSKFDIFKYTIKKHYDFCLQSSVYIDYQGNIIPCFNEIRSVVGNITTESVNKVMKKLITTYWNNPLRNEKCSSCEFIYACPSCRCSNSINNCKYNPYEGIWDK